jgi:SOS-response transcriptional repressor LexA
MAIEASGRKQSAIAADAGVAPQTLSRILHSVGPSPAFDTIVRIAHAVNENVGWILGERGFPLSETERRELAAVVEFLQNSLLAAGPLIEVTASNATPVRGGRARIPPEYHALGARLVYRAEGNCMLESGIADRDLLFVRPSSAVREAAGHVVVFRLNGAEYVRQLELEKGRIRLVSRNLRYAPIEVEDESAGTGLVGIVVGRSGMTINS